MGCGTIICIAVAGDFGVCHADCHEGKCRNALYELGCSSAGWRKKMAKRIGCCRAAMKEYELPQWAH